MASTLGAAHRTLPFPDCSIPSWAAFMVIILALHGAVNAYPRIKTRQIGLFCKTAIPPCLCEWQIATARASPASSCNAPFKPSMDMTIRATWSFDAPPNPVSPCLTALGEYSKTGTPADAQTAITTPLTCPRIIAVLAFLKKKPPSRAAASGWVRPISDAVLS